MAVGARERLRRSKHAIGETLRDLVSLTRINRRRLGFGDQRPLGDAPRILIFDELLPDPRFGAGFPRAAEMLQAVLDAGWQATVYPMHAAPDDYVGVRNRFPRGVEFLRGTDERGMRRLMRESVGRFDAVLISRPTVMQRFVRICEALPAFTDRAYCIYDAEAMFGARDALRLALFEGPMSADEYAAALDAEIALMRGVRAVISVTEAEARLFRARTAVAVHVISHTTAVRRETPGFDARKDLLFVGKSVGRREDSPNVDSLVWFVEEIMPLLDGHLGPDYRLFIAGLADGALMTRLASARVTFLGVVDDLVPWYDRCRVFVAPTRFAAGLPLKVVEAAAAGVPCVVTDLLAEQLRFGAGTECVAAGRAGAFADGCAALYADAGRWTQVREAALSRIETDYSREAFGAAVRHLLEASIASKASVAAVERRSA